MTTTFGDRDVALSLFESVMVKGDCAPARFKDIGAGCYRQAFLDTYENLVYKVGDYHSNVNEARTARMLAKKSTRSLGFDLHIPRTRTYRMPTTPEFRRIYDGGAVIVQEYAEGARTTDCDANNFWMDVIPDCTCRQTPCHSKVLEAVSKWSGLDDIHSENVLVDEATNTYWLIDLAM